MKNRTRGEEKRLLYIPDFEQDYPTYPRVIDAFAKSYADTNYELILYIKNDQLLEEKLSALNELFEQYEDVNCYINLFIENLTDERSLFGQADAYICNRSIDNITHIDMADLFQIPVISSVDIPIFTERKISSMTTIKETNKEETTDISTIKKLVQTVKAIKDTTTTLSSNLSQLSVNQYAMNCSIHNLKYELFADMEQPVYPKIAPGKEAIDTIINDHKSLCRLGDGEFAVIAGINRQKFQHADKKLALRLQEVLRSNDDNILLGIPDIYGDLSKYNDGCQYNIRTYLTPKTREEHYSLLDMNRTYYDAYLTRPYASYLDNNTDMPQKRFNHLKQIWDNRKLLIIEGAQTRMGIGNDLFDNASDIIRILGPAEHAFDRYDELLNTALQQDKSKLVLIALGPTATVLAYDLALAGFQALDIGHIDIEYEWMLAGSGTKFPVKGKYTNEATGGNIVEDIYDSAYEKQIIAKFY